MNDLMPGRRRALYRSNRERLIAGVCGGISEVYGWDVNLVRIVFFILALTTSITFWVYLFAWLLLPQE